MLKGLVFVCGRIQTPRNLGRLILGLVSGARLDDLFELVEELLLGLLDPVLSQLFFCRLVGLALWFLVVI